MKYVVLVSHGTFAPGLKSVLAMLAGGEREDVISVGLEDGMSADTFAEKFQEAISGINHYFSSALHTLQPKIHSNSK